VFCPIDKEPLAVLEYEDVEVDFCFECGGVWLDAGELELLLGPSAHALAELRGGDRKAVGKEEHRRCPLCEVKMEKVVTRGGEPVVYDRCPRGHGLWFDHGELEDVLRRGFEATGSDRVVTFLRGVFGEEPGKE
jgi:hypothetical protein